ALTLTRIRQETIKYVHPKNGNQADSRGGGSGTSTMTSRKCGVAIDMVSRSGGATGVNPVAWGNNAGTLTKNPAPLSPWHSRALIRIVVSRVGLSVLADAASFLLQ